MLEPTLLLLDEPLGALDLKLREHMKIELKQLQADFGTTFVYITHDQSEALVLSDHVAVMNAGRFEQVGTPQELYYQPATPFVAGFVGANNRIAGKAARVDGDVVELVTREGLSRPRARERRRSRPATRSRRSCGPRSSISRATRPNCRAARSGSPARVASLLFDGANSAVLVREETTGAEIRIALPQTGRFADLDVGETIAFGFDPAARRLLPRRRPMAVSIAAARHRHAARCGSRCCCCWRRRCSGSSVSSCCRTSSSPCFRCARAWRRGSTSGASTQYATFFDEPLYWHTFVRTAVMSILATACTLAASPFPSRGTSRRSRAAARSRCCSSSA